MHIDCLLKEFYPNGLDKPFNKNKLKNKELRSLLIELTSFLVIDVSFSERLFCLKNNKTPNICECGNLTKYKSPNIGYAIFCSKDCMNKSEKTKSKRKSTTVKNYGGLGFASTSINEKVKQTNLENYGVEIAAKSKEISDKISKTWKTLDKQQIEDKRKATNLIKYGYEFHQQNAKQTEKIKQTLISKYGGMGYASTSINAKIKETTMDRFGTENAMLNTDVQEKLKQTMSEKYGVDNISELGNEKWNNFKNNFDIATFTMEKSLQEMEKDFEVRYFTISKFLQQYGFKFSKISSFEQSLRLFLYEDFKFNDRTLLNGKELDLYSEKYKFAIEFDGLFYHSEEYHADPLYHLNKTIICENKGVQLFHIFENEWLEKLMVIKSLIDIKLNRNIKHIDISQCEIKEVDLRLKDEFLEKNHIDGTLDNVFNIGAFYQDELVSIISLSKLNLNEFQLDRYCSKLNHKINNDLDGLLNFFNQKWKSNIVTVKLNRRYENGDIYEKYGFTKIATTSPNFYLLNKNKLIIPETNNPDDFKDQNKIWDCGCLIYRKCFI